MSMTQLKQTLESRVLKTELVNWREFKFIQQDNFKELSQEDRSKLKASILANNFTQPFYVWQEIDSGTYFCLDGRHRVLMLLELLSEGYDIPYLLPATFIFCKDKTEAARLVLIYSSMYAKVSQQGLFDFVQSYDLDYLNLKDQIDLPDFSTARFEQKFDVFQISNDVEDYEVTECAESDIVQIGDLFELDNHRLVCGSFADDKIQSMLLNKSKARILLTDPPYNLPANTITTVKNRHEDFVMAAGEMTDDEFVCFLESIMKVSCDHTLPGAIHYIFMDWRHAWHITEAGRSIYGSVIPKQLCVWAKDLMALGSFYRSQHELIFIYKNGEDKHLSHLELIDRIRSNVWSYPSANSQSSPDRGELLNHCTPKNSQMIAEAILDTTDLDEIVLDWFLGSGTTLIAAAKTGRRCYGSEIEPRFVQSIIKRYILFCKKNGRDINFKHVNGSLTLNDFCNEQSKN